MALTFSPRFVTETDEKPPWTDCAWASALMLANKASEGKYPATRIERELLRDASGDHFGGSNLDDVAKGILNRYGWTLSPARPTWDALLYKLGQNCGALVTGLYSRLPDHFTRWDRAFANKGMASGHAAYVQGHDRGGNYHLGPDGLPEDVFWCDPLGRRLPGQTAAQSYRGEWLAASDLRDFLLHLDSDQYYVALAAQGSAK